MHSRAQPSASGPCHTAPCLTGWASSAHGRSHLSYLRSVEAQRLIPASSLCSLLRSARLCPQPLALPLSHSRGPAPLAPTGNTRCQSSHRWRPAPIRTLVAGRAVTNALTGCCSQTVSVLAPVLRGPAGSLAPGFSTNRQPLFKAL